MKITKKLLSIVLSVGMVFTSVSTPNFTFAEDLATDTDATVIEETTTEEQLEVEQTTEQVEINDISEEETNSETDAEESTEEINLVTFDHNYSDVDTSIINTSELFVQTNDVTVFTYNTTVESNYDNVYIISFDSVDEARFAYSYYVDKVDYITDLSNVVSLSEESEEQPTEDVADLSNVNEGDDALSNLNDIDVTDYSGYIALIDSGANADVNLDITGTGTNDTLGHGTKMYNYIKEENPNAKVLSIKAFEGNKTDAASVYAAIKLAIESKVSIINMSFVANDIEKNEIIKDAINEAIANNIIVIGAAGNYSGNAKNYIPGCIDDVITVGAVNEDGTLYETSNYNADLYVVATSTSEATARYSGIYTSGNESDKVFIEVVPEKENDDVEELDGVTLQFGANSNNFTPAGSPGSTILPEQINATSSISGSGTSGISFTVTSVNAERPYQSTSGPYGSENWSEDMGHWVTADEINNNGLWTGSYGYTAGVIPYPCTDSNIQGWRSYVNSAWWDSAIWWGSSAGDADNELAHDAGVPQIQFGTGYNHSSYGITCCEHPNSNTNYTGVGSVQSAFIKVWERRYGDEASGYTDRAIYVGGFDAPSGRQCMAVAFMIETTVPYYYDIVIKKDSTLGGDRKVSGCNIDVYDSAGSSWLGDMSEIETGTYRWYTDWMTSGNYGTVSLWEVTGGTDQYGTSYNNSANNNKYITSSGSLSNSLSTVSTTIHYQNDGQASTSDVALTADQTPIYKARVRKVTAPGTNMNCITNNPYYSLTGTQFSASGDAEGTFTIGANGYSNILDVTMSGLRTGEINITETKVGLGYMPAKTDYTIDVDNPGSNVIVTDETDYRLLTITIPNTPIGDPADIKLKKVNKDNGTINGSMSAVGAIYEVKQYYCAPHVVNSNSPVATAQFTTKSDGSFNMRSDTPTSGYLNKFSDGSLAHGTYVIKEIKAPEGFKLSNNTFKVFLHSDESAEHYNERITEFYKNDVRISEADFVDGAIPEKDEPQIWYNLALLKGDKDSAAPTAQGDAVLSNAVFQVYATRTDVFANFNKHDNNTYTVDSQNRVCVNGSPLQITTGANGFGQTNYPVLYSNINNVYYVKEIQAPVGYKLNTNQYNFAKPTLSGNDNNIVKKTLTTNGTTYQVDAYVTPNFEHEDAGHLNDEVQRGGFAMCKLDEFRDEDTNGTASLAATFQLINNSSASVFVNGSWYDSGAVIQTFTTAKKTINGHSYYEYHSNAKVLPYGTYKIIETTPGTGYMNPSNGDFTSRGLSGYTFTIRKDGDYNIHGTDAYINDIKATVTGQEYTTNNSEVPTNVVNKGTFALEKWDADRNEDIAQGDADLSATFELVNNCGKTISVDMDGNGSINGSSEIFANNAVIMTFDTDKSGRFTQTRLDLLPYGDYTIREKSGAKGYLNSTTRGGKTSVSFSITKNQEVVVFGSTDFLNNTVKSISWVNTTSGNTSQVNYTHKGTITIEDPVMRGSIHVKKNDKNITTEQGDATFADIKYAIVNRSTTSTDPVTGRTASDGKVYLNNVLYAPGQIVAIITTNANGEATQANLPYGTYDVYELRADSTWAVGDTWSDSSTKNGTSKYANNHGYLHTDQFDTAELHSSDEYTVTKANNSVREEDATYDDNFYNYPARATIEIQKHDAETGLTTNQGVNKLSGIRYALVNRSAKKVMYKDDVFEVGEVIDVLTTDENGYTSATDIPYGTYDVYELRQDSTIAAHDVYNSSSAKYGTSNKANDYYIYSNHISKLINLNNANPTYTVEVQNQSVREVSETYKRDFNNAPLRADLTIKKIDINGYNVANIPWLISLMDDDGNVVESHVIMSDKNGNLNTKTRGNKTASTVNTLDQYYDGTDSYTGPLDDAATDVNIWFGDIDKYTTSDWVNNSRGSLLYGHYKITELMCDNNAGNIMLEDEFDVTEDFTVIDLDRIFVDLDIIIKSVAKDAHSDSDCLTISENATLLDELNITHLKVGFDYKVVTEVWNVLEDGTKTKISDTSADPYIFTAEATTDDPETTYVDLDVEFNTDTTGCVPGSKVSLVTKLYMKLNDEWTSKPIAVHNTDCTDEKQTIYVPKLESEASNATTETRIGSIDPKTKVIDSISYWNLGDKVDYTITLTLKDDNNKTLKDVNGNDCVKSFVAHVDSRLNDTDEFRFRNGITVIPQTGTFDFAKMGWEAWEIEKPEDSKSVYVVADVVEQFWNETTITHNEKLDLDIQTVRYLQIGTTAGSVVDVASGQISKQGMIPNNTEARLRDIIDYSNCAQDVHVIVEGTVVEKETQEVVTTATQEYDLEQVGPNDTKSIYLDFVFDSTPYAEKKLVVFEKIYMMVGENKVLIADHSDINDTKQTVRVPDIHTTLNSIVEHNNYKVTKNSGHVDLIDYVTYKNVVPGKNYTMTCVLMDKETGEPVYDIYGNLVTATVPFNADNEEGVVEVPISFDSVPRDIKWETDDGYVAYEEFKGDDSLTYAVHNDINDKNQTVLNPKFKTKAINLSDTKFIVAAPDQKITDNVTLRNFDKANENGDTFTLKITAVDAETGEVLKDTNGNDYTNTKEFVWNGQTEEPITITIDATDLAGRTIVFYENLYYGSSTNEDDELLREDDVDSHAQSVYIPQIGTMATDATTNIKLLTLENIIKDEISLENLIPDQDYVIVTKLWNKTDDRFVLNNDGTEFESKSNYHSPSNDVEEANWTNKNYSVDDVATVTMDVSNVEKLAGKDIVVFEYLYYVNTDKTEDFYTEHTDKNDEDQTLQVPDGFTTAIADKTEDHLVKAEPNTKFTDTITYKNLIPDLEYSVTATLMVYKSDEFDGENTKYEPLKDKDGKVVTKTIPLIPEEKDGTVDVDFEIDTTLLKGKTIVVFEDMYYEDTKVFVHADITDEAQSIHVPDGYTTAVGDKTKEHVVRADKDITIIDTITYSNLVPNKSYTAVGTLYKKVVKDGKTTGEPLLDEKGNVITNKVTFKPEKANGTVEVPFTINTSYLKGEKIVVFEDVLYNGDVSIFTHADIEDKGQTVNIPKGHTTAKDSKSDKHLAKASTETTIIDTIWYENLIPGIEYEATGLLMSAKTGKPYEVDGKTFTNTVKFTPTEANGTVDVPITINTTNLEGSTIVVFEDVTVNGETVFIHHDLTDEDQSVHITKVGTKATDKVDNDNTIDGTSTEQTIIDTVKYENLIVGKEYTVKGKLVIKPTEEQKKDANYKTEYVTDKDGKVVEASVTFTAEQANGEIQVPFTIDASKYAGKKLVAFESIEYEGVEIGAHMDIDDEEQTIIVSLQLHVQIAKADKDNIKYFLKGAEITIFNQDGTVAKDIDGNDCVGVTDENGEVNFTVMYQENNTYYAQETKAPSGYNINNDKFEITPSNDRESAGTDLIKISILDTSIAIPPSTPKTGDILLVVFGLIALIGIGGIFVYRKKKTNF